MLLNFRDLTRAGVSVPLASSHQHKCKYKQSAKRIVALRTRKPANATHSLVNRQTKRVTGKVLIPELYKL